MSDPVDDAPVILFDGVCNLCDRTVRWIIARDRRAAFRFASLRSRAAGRILESAPADLPDSVALVERGRVRTRSDAVIAIARSLGFPWSLATVFVVLPRRWRDALYDWIARHRYRWFGRKDACMVPTPELRARFLDADETVAERTDLPAASEQSASAEARSAAPTPGRL